MEADHSNLKILGQEISYPASWYAVSGVLIVSLLVGFVAWVYFVAAGHEHLEAFTSLVQHRFSSKGILEEKTNYRIIQFWTPSEKTQKDFGTSKAVGEYPKWQTVSEEKVNEFGRRLTNLSTIAGHRRYEVVGHGRGVFKHGWWWVVTIKDDLKLDDFAKFYTGYWGNPNDIYFEEHRAHEQYGR